MFDRLSRYYKIANQGCDASMSVVWKTITEHFHTRLHNILMSGNEEQFREYMKQCISLGDLHGIEAPVPLTEQAEVQCLNMLAAKIGILPIKNPEQESPTYNWKPKDTIELVKRIEQELGFQMTPPTCSAYSGKVPLRFFYYCSAAIDIRRMFNGSFPKKILEIGPGLGNLAMMADRLGSESYSMIDLPSCSCMAAYFLAEIFGENEIWLYGEKEDDAPFVRIYPCTDTSVDFGKFDLIFNSDSMPEMPEQSQDRYVDLIGKILNKDGVFLSINHESDNLGQRRVFDSCSKSKSLRLVSRHPFMMREGYIQEVFSNG